MNRNIGAAPHTKPRRRIERQRLREKQGLHRCLSHPFLYLSLFFSHQLMRCIGSRHYAHALIKFDHTPTHTHTFSSLLSLSLSLPLGVWQPRKINQVSQHANIGRTNITTDITYINVSSDTISCYIDDKNSIGHSDIFNSWFYIAFIFEQVYLHLGKYLICDIKLQIGHSRWFDQLTF